MARKTAAIADSDGESEVDVAPTLPQLPPLLPPDLNGTTPDIDLGVNFSDFLSQSQARCMDETQHLPQHKEPAEEAERAEGIETAEKSTGTTASLKRQIESEQRKFAEQKDSSSGLLSDIRKPPKSHSSDSPIVAKTKRRRTELVAMGQIDGGRDSKRKRHNTYGSSSSSRLLSSQTDMFTEELRFQVVDQVVNLGSNSVLEAPLNQLEQNGSFSDEQADSATEIGHVQIAGYAQSHLNNREAAQHYHSPNQPALGENSNINHDPFKEYMQMSSGRISTSRSLMGNHESINLDYSDTRAGLDVNANPFGDVSQQSVEGHNDGTEPESLEEIFRPSTRTNIETTLLSDDHESCTQNRSHSHPTGVDETNKLRDDSSCLTSGRSKSFVDPCVLSKNPSDDAQDVLNSSHSSPWKRRKTLDGLAFSVTPTANEVDSKSMVRAAPDASELRAETQGKKRGRKPKNRIVETNDDFLQEHSQRKDNTKDDGGFTKHPSSELHQDDESATGLPQEQYKPRPSRSRSKRIIEVEMPPPSHAPINSVHTPVKQARTPDIDDTIQLDEPEDTPLTKLKKGKQKKNKMKRAKTSAAALRKKSDKMLSDGEEDVIWVESKPTTVKMKLPDPLEVKHEEFAKGEQPAPNDSAAEVANTIARKKQPVVDGPSEAADPSFDSIQEEKAEEQPVKPPPKKRGRKKKTTIEIPGSIDTKDNLPEPLKIAQDADEEPATEEEPIPPQSKLQPSSSSSHRQVLSEKDPNKSHSTTDLTIPTTSTPQKPSTIKYPPPTHTPSPTKADISTDVTETETPQPKSTTNPDSTGTGKGGPTRHSPINPTGGKVKYRVGLSRRAAIPPLLKIVRK